MNNLKIRVVLNWRLSAIFLGIKTKSPESFLFRAVVTFKSYIKYGFVYKLIWRVFCAYFFIQNGTASCKHTLIEFETFGSYFISQSEHLYKTLNVFSESKVK